ncbi:hypothetical protein H4219_004071 [Mycoemilia scoparia]|uniref:Cytosol aminopeptidase domain-containing protein n=1 Tax=Mycoemilia scoparia TaxID=417184 RepID=A0A9W7ZTD3_9FUNG|nr:hypothetical protein H4219_004071 [Mycoemilia scoparia]
MHMGYGDPERMTPYKCAEHIKQVFCGLDNVTYEEVKDIETIKREYPLLYHSSRASLAAKNTWPCVVKLRYRSSNRSDVKEHMYLVGKGVTYDTGGISIKTGGAMRGMSRDKLGACGVAGFVLSAALLKTTEVDITALLPFERNSVGPDSLLPDEILITRAGVRVLINDTDAEGRLIMADSICECKEEIVKSRKEAQKSGQPAVPSSIFTVATLTGHVIRAYGWYGASVANGPARKAGYDQRLAKSGKAWGDPFECSILRRDDFDFIAAKTDREDVYQTNDKASVSTSRGHMFPAAFLIKATGLDQHSLASGPENRIPFIHMDVAGSAEDGIEPGLGLPGITGSPICVLAGAFLNI